MIRLTAWEPMSVLRPPPMPEVDERMTESYVEETRDFTGCAPARIMLLEERPLPTYPCLGPSGWNPQTVLGLSALHRAGRRRNYPYRTARGDLGQALPR